MKGLEGKVAVVTGGASGIGYSIVEQLLEHDVKVAIGDLNEEKLKEIEQQFPEKVVGVKANVTSEDDMKNLVDTAVEKFGQLDYGFNVAGLSKPGLIMDQSFEDWKTTVDIVLHGVFLATKHEANAMKEHGGAIVNISSLNAHVPMFYGAAYASAKAGVEMFTKNAALEFAEHKIRVNAILPGLVETPITTGFFENEDLNNEFMGRIPERRAAAPAEIASPSLFLVSDDASYINGTSLVVDGGWEITGYPNLSKFM
ncbi:SDR family NAD(P)-dependent oxidoreductase [Salinicoccus kekensis]|uniref:3-oxoacyl-[acyl-carrier-protein] reductase FabG n=1 Tax=Salinicoccus kekensis TaxID=714307 RepID=A0A285UP47_9STAP|nr:SDR family NAD(P)-dependent oxidoreductase [Salinicoccus kekensis]SOC43685.1 NAD(P)-dependent dehydrogenase (short-subunit alcohol dehydrogenase family) [Salinicoccus kekensis]